MSRLILITILLSLGLFLSAQTASPPAVGDGSENNPYRIDTLENLYWIAASNDVVSEPDQATRWSSHYLQISDIEASETAYWFEGQGWSPIGVSSDIHFSGSYNGSDHNITNLYINRYESDYLGLFGYTFGADIRNLGLVDIYVSGNSRIGALVGQNEHTSVTNCFSTGSIQGVNSIAGGLIGANRYSIIRNCYSEANVQGNYSTGGLTGNNAYSMIISSISSGLINGGLSTGGLVGINVSSLIQNCFSTSTVSGINSNTGGLVGSNTDQAIIRSCYSTGEVTGNQYVGGLAGIINNHSIIENCFNRGNVTGINFVGGLVGSIPLSIVRNCYSTGFVSGRFSTGGLVATLGQWDSGTVENSYWDYESSGIHFSAGGYGRDTAAMTYPYGTNTYIEWDFADIWGDDVEHSDNDGYPYLLMPDYEDFPFLTVYPDHLDFGEIPVNEVTIPQSYIISGRNLTSDVTITVSNGFEISLIEFGEYQSTLTIPQNEGGVEQEIWVRLRVTHPIDYSGRVVNSSPGAFPGYVHLSGTGIGTIVPVAIQPVGNGSLSNPYVIETLENLYWLTADNEIVPYPPQSVRWSRHYIQSTDIDASETLNWVGGSGLSSVGLFMDDNSEDNIPLTGTYNGQGHTISGLYMDHTFHLTGGLFGYTDGASISNLGLTGIDIKGYMFVGGLVGISKNSTISNCFVIGSVQGFHYTGGLVGVNHTSLIDNCYNEASVSGNYMTGGLVGLNYSDALITNSHNNGEVFGYSSLAGGLVAENHQSSIEYCYNLADISGESTVGGLVGVNQEGIINSSFNDGNVSGMEGIGGLAANNHSNSLISNSYNTGSVEGYQFVGGFSAANSSEIFNCYSIGSVNGILHTGGLYASQGSNAITISSYWNTETSGQTTSAGGEGRTTAEMTYPYDPLTYYEWDFDDVWLADVDNQYNNGYPYLQNIDYTSTEEELIVPVNGITLSNYPNPFNPETTITFHLPHRSDMKLVVFNIKGQRLTTLLAEEREAGTHQVIWNGRDDRGKEMASGVYFYQLSTGKERITRKMMLLK